MLLFYILVLLSVIAHEAGHAYELIKNGGKLKTFGIGIPIPKVPYISLQVNNISFELHPFLVGAFVEPVDDGWVESASNIKLKRFYAGGFMGNMVFAVISIVIVFLATSPLNIAPLLAMSVIAYYLRDYIYSAMPYIGIVMLCTLLYLILGDIMSGTFLAKSSIIRFDESMRTAITQNDIPNQFSLLKTILAGALVSFVLGVGNMMPITFLDGWHIISLDFKRLFGEKYEDSDWLQWAKLAGVILLAVLTLIPIGVTLYEVFFGRLG